MANHSVGLRLGNGVEVHGNTTKIGNRVKGWGNRPNCGTFDEVPAQRCKSQSDLESGLFVSFSQYISASTVQTQFALFLFFYFRLIVSRDYFC